MAELIIALDVENGEKALALAKSLQGLTSWFKIGLELFIAQGPKIVEDLKNLGFRIFLDLKLYDIPNTVAAGVRSACQLDVDMLTVHCQGGQRMCEAALETVKKYSRRETLVFGVTALTSFAEGEMPGIAVPPQEYAFELAALAADWGLHGIVCSGHEVGKISAEFPQLRCLCPGIRPKMSDHGDQRRVVSPEYAVRSGADYLVVGRPIILSTNPVELVRSINQEIVSATSPRDQ